MLATTGQSARQSSTTTTTAAAADFLSCINKLDFVVLTETWSHQMVHSWFQVFHFN